MDRDLSRSRAILIGNATYRSDSGIPDLPAAAESVTAMADLLSGGLCGWSADRITQLVDVAAPHELARRLTAAVKEVSDVVLLYYAGHGLRTPKGQLALTLSDSDADPTLVGHTAMLYENIADILRGSPADTKLVILDCCHAELGNRANSIFQGVNDLVEAYPVDGLYCIWASKVHEKAKTPVGSALTYFTANLITTVQEGIPGRPEFLAIDQIFVKLRDRMARQGLPEPVDSGTRGARQFLFARNAAFRAFQTEDDGYDALAPTVGLDRRQVMLLRACAKYLRQSGMRFSEDNIQRVLRSNRTITQLLARLFESRFDPARQDGAAERCEMIVQEIRSQLDKVDRLDHDRILGGYLALIEAILRTNYYKQDSPGGVHGTLVLKLDPGRLSGLTSPQPKFEIYVYSSRVEAVHLRFGPVARGGVRWAQRLEDFRAKVLALGRAEELHNAVIVPSSAKGGIVCKRLPAPSDREAYRAEVLACWKTFIAAVLDVTDNIENDTVVPPPGVVRRDGDDPYMVLAADKHTAASSDAANEVAHQYSYWLGDAFASGGSQGYDHKKMGITARGAWESVRFHFRTLGLDVDTDEFTVAGIGDMSGDVFGNGMLLSEKIKLVGAFDHRDIFLDPDPGPAVSFAERRRMFDLPRSSWGDYDTSLISGGGGVWPRSAKLIPISLQARAALGIDSEVKALSSDALISAILAAPVDLLWHGGVGTYVKATTESHVDVGDRSNDEVRIDAAWLRARVIGEGSSLGLTQRGRIEYAMVGGLINTDFIDNSAGVDTSDHEVNIKILLNGPVHDGEMSYAERDRLLHEMTDEVAALVLPHNYAQNIVLAASGAQAVSMLHVHGRYLRKLERDGKLRRRLEVLPSDKELAERPTAGVGLTRPELSVLLARTKIDSAKEVLASELPDDAYLHNALVRYFPGPLRQAYVGQMAEHPLRREIITTVVVNDMVDRSGITFWFRLNEETGASGPDITRAWLVARDVFGMPSFWDQVQRLDGVVDVNTQIDLLLEGRKLTERAARWLLHNRRSPFGITDTVDFFADGVLAVGSGLPKLLTGLELEGFVERREQYLAAGVPETLANRVAAMVPAYSAFDIVEIARATGRDVEATAEVYFDLADRLQITQLRDRITALPRDVRWNTAARSALRNDLYAAHAVLARDVLQVTGGGSPEERLARWAQRNAAAVARATQTLTEIWESDQFTFTSLSTAVYAFRTLAAASYLP